MTLDIRIFSLFFSHSVKDQNNFLYSQKCLMQQHSTSEAFKMNTLVPIQDYNTEKHLKIFLIHLYFFMPVYHMVEFLKLIFELQKRSCL